MSELKPQPWCVIDDRFGLAKLRLAGTDAAAKLDAALGFAAPDAGRMTGDEQLGCIRIGPLEWLLTGSAANVEAALARVEQAFQGDLALILDMSHGAFVLRLSGMRATERLAAYCELDLHSDVFRVGHATRTRFGDIAVTVARTDDRPTFMLIADQSYADYVMRLIDHAARLIEPAEKSMTAATPAVSCVLRFRCPDQPGILAFVTPFLAESGWDIREASIYGDPQSVTFFVRMELASDTTTIAALEAKMPELSDRLKLDWEIHDLSRATPVLIAVSKFHHCLVDLIHKTEIGQLPIRIVGVVSNHETARSLVEWHGLPFHHLPVDRADKAAQEGRFLDLIRESGAELTVLARYMQILSDDFADALAGRCINIHHSFLPSFKGARPYHQAKARGVKLIGATAHYVTSELDEGPIIEQDVRRVTHATTAEEMVAIGREVEASVLSRAVRWHVEHRVLPNGNQTVVLA